VVIDGVEALVQTRHGWLRMSRPSSVIEARGITDVLSAIGRAETLARETGAHAAGFVSYEAGAAFGLTVAPALRQSEGRPDDRWPLVWFGIFPQENVTAIDGPARGGDYALGPLSADVDRQAFERAFNRIKDHIAAGDTYQVNYTFRMRAAFDGDARSLFADLAAAQQGRYAVFLDLGDRAVCSASPELFFERAAGQIQARPMKGTVARGRTLEEDKCQQKRLLESPKQRAENVMIVDMVRNDLGRIAEVGTVAVPELFTVERYPNVWQMTSLVTGRTGAPLADIFAAVHPSASVTGAPKVRTMELLAGLERGPRGPYTGAIGHIAPDGDARFNVGIRTATVDKVRHQVQFGIGSGIVWDSGAADEYAECLVKAAVLGRRPVAFELLETMRWAPGEGFFLLDRHLSRLRESAEYFGFSADESVIRRRLESAVAGCEGVRRVRLLVARDGAVRVEQTAASFSDDVVQVRLADAPVDSQDVFLFHKTTNRAVYDRARAGGGGSADVVLWNGQRQVTEATLANIVVAVDSRKVTPPVGCGLLAGTFRAELLARGEISERVVTVEELRQASELWLVNSVQGWRRARLS
jgi:para-aminobenzoate synthetase/4-amino-4-deoxychorismate lyase